MVKIIFLILFIILLATYILSVSSYSLLRLVRIKFLEKFFCKIGWHSHSYDNAHHSDKDPLNFLVFAKCKWCTYEGQVDSQGNLF